MDVIDSTLSLYPKLCYVFLAGLLTYTLLFSSSRFLHSDFLLNNS